MALTRTPTKVWLHKLFGRSIALLAFVQVALGLTLYGSPKALFIVYALAGALLIFLYLALDRRTFEKRPVNFGLDNGPEFYSDYGSYLSGSRTDYRSGAGAGGQSRERERSHWGRNILAGVGAAGAVAAIKRRSSERSARRENRQNQETEGERRERIEQEEMDS